MPNHSRKNARRATLNSLKEQLYSLNMRMLLAMQNHDAAAQAALRLEQEKVQNDIDRMCFSQHPSEQTALAGNK